MFKCRPDTFPIGSPSNSFPPMKASLSRLRLIVFPVTHGLSTIAFVLTDSEQLPSLVSPALSLAGSRMDDDAHSPTKVDDFFQLPLLYGGGIRVAVQSSGELYATRADVEALGPRDLALKGSFLLANLMVGVLESQVLGVQALFF